MTDSFSIPDAGCVDPDRLTLFARGLLPESERGEVERHVSHCDPCRTAVWNCAAADAPARPAFLRLRAVRRGAAIAAAALLAVGGTAAYRMGRPGPDRSERKAAIERLPLLAGEIRTSGREGRDVCLADGTRLRIGSHTALKPVEASAGERWALRLESGELEADVSPASGAARVLAPAGEIEILGTRFRAKAFRLRLFSRVREALAVELEQGKVRVQGPEGGLTLLPPSRGIVIEGESPIRQEVLTDWRKVLLDLAGAVRPAVSPGESWFPPGSEASAAAVVAALWVRVPEEFGDWERVLREAPSPELRRGAAALLGICAADEALDALRDARRAETDANVQEMLKSVLACRLGVEQNGYRKDLNRTGGER